MLQLECLDCLSPTFQAWRFLNRVSTTSIYDLETTWPWAFSHFTQTSSNHTWRWAFWSGRSLQGRWTRLRLSMKGLCLRVVFIFLTCFFHDVTLYMVMFLLIQHFSYLHSSLKLYELWFSILATYLHSLMNYLWCSTSRVFSLHVLYIFSCIPGCFSVCVLHRCKKRKNNRTPCH